MKCTQCGCEDLEEVRFPYKANLIMTEPGCRGEAAYYYLDQTSHADTYICTRCGHFEFFNPILAESIIQKRKKEKERLDRIEEIETKIRQSENKIKEYNEKIDQIFKQLENLEITVRKSNELKEQEIEFTKKIKSLQEKIDDLKAQKKRLESR